MKKIRKKKSYKGYGKNPDYYSKKRHQNEKFVKNYKCKVTEKCIVTEVCSDSCPNKIALPKMIKRLLGCRK